MKKALLVSLMAACIGGASAGQDPKLCEMVGSLAQGIAEDRDRGVSYNAELGKIKGASQDVHSYQGIMLLSKSALKTVYLDMPKITPEGAYKLHYVACMSVGG
jgi:hypothetical protein